MKKNEPNTIFAAWAGHKKEKLDRTYNISKIKTGIFYQGMPEEELTKIINNRLSNYVATEKILKEIKKKYRPSFSTGEKFNLKYKIRHSNTRDDYGVKNQVMNYKKYNKNWENIRKMFNELTASTDNELLSILPKGYKIGLLRSFRNPVTDSDNQIDFWIESGDQSPINFNTIADILIQKYGTSQSRIEVIPYSKSDYLRLVGLGDKILIFRNRLSDENEWDTLNYRAYIIILNKSRFSYRKMEILDEDGYDDL